MRIAGVISAVLFVLCGGAMNVAFALTLGTDRFTTACWAALSVSATLYTLAGLDLAQSAFRQRENARGVAATFVLIFSLGYDVMSAYAFAARQHASTTYTASATTRLHQTALEDLSRAEAELASYLDAQPVEVALQHERALQQQVELLIPATRCNRPPDRLKLACEHRANVSEGLRKAEAARVRAETRVRLTAAVAASRAALSSAPAPQAPDPRAQLLGDAGAEWLPVLLITIGSLLGFFASQWPAASSPKRDESPRSVAKIISPSKEAPTTHAPISPPPRNDRSHICARLLKGLDDLHTAERLPVGLTYDDEGYIRGTQRALAAATGLRHVSTFNRAIKRATDEGLVDVASHGPCTGVRLLSPAKKRAPA